MEQEVAKEVPQVEPPLEEPKEAPKCNGSAVAANPEDEMWKKMYEKTQEASDNKRIQEVDDGFFEKFGHLKESVETKEAIKEEENLERENYLEDDSSQDEPILDNLSLEDESATIKETNAEDLFCDVYYQCTHLVGKDAAEGLKKDQLLAYLKDLFEFDDAKCKSLVDIAKNKPAPQLMLKVEVIEAKNLSPKDANGSSDPYCTLWISSSQTNRPSTSVKEQTLDPIWRENFCLPVSSATNDVLHFEVWDFDPAETVKDKMTKISEIKGFWGAKKLAKEMLQTVSSGKHDNELIGSAQITLKNIPSTGQKAWFNLVKKNKKVNNGMIALKMLFGSEKDERVALEEHRYLIKTLLQRLYKQPEFEPSEWNGDFGTDGELLLRQHLAQSNLAFTEDCLSKFVEYVNMHQVKPLNFAILAQLTNHLSVPLKNNSLKEGEVKMYWNSVRKLLPSCFNSIRKIRRSNPGDQKLIKQLDGILCIIQDLSSCNVPADVNLFPANFYNWVQTVETFSIKSILHEAVLHGACDWFEYLARRHKPVDSTDEAILKHLVKITQLISLDLQGAIDHHELLFKERLNYPYAKTLFAVYQSRIVEMVSSVITDMCMMLKPLNFEKVSDKDANNDPLASGTSMFELYLTLQGIERTGARLFSNDDTYESFEIRQFYSWFYSGVVRWLDIAAYKALQRIERAVELDNFAQVDSTVQYSSSAIDTMAIFHQVKTFWEQLAWPDVEGSYAFIAKIIDDICKGSVHYADHVAAKVEGLGETKNAIETKFEVTPEWCVAINNIDYIHLSIHPFVRALGLDKLFSSLADFQNNVAAEHCKQTLELVMSNAVENVNHKIGELLEKLTSKMEPPILRFLQEGAELLHQQCSVLERLMQYLEDSLGLLHSRLNHDNFNRVLQVTWEKLSSILFSLVENGIEKRRPPSYFANLNATLNALICMFKVDEATTQEEESELTDKLSEVKQLLHIYGMETPELINEFYMEKLQEQNDIEKSENGELRIAMHFEGDKLEVEVLNAYSIRAMDSNGLCDPFVSVRLLPKEIFPGTKRTTKVHKKTLSPLFDETFTFQLTPEQRATKNALLMFVMKDQDFCGVKNDYMAEAYALLSDASETKDGGYAPQISLKLSRPRIAGSKIFKALDYRQGDKLARDFVKKRRMRLDKQLDTSEYSKQA